MAKVKKEAGPIPRVRGLSYEHLAVKLGMDVDDLRKRCGAKGSRSADTLSREARVHLIEMAEGSKQSVTEYVMGL